PATSARRARTTTSVPASASTFANAVPNDPAPITAALTIVPAPRTADAQTTLPTRARLRPRIGRSARGAGRPAGGWQDDRMASPDDRVHVVIPVKSLARAKSRLQPLMPAAPRRALVLAMFLDTLAAAQSAEAVAAVTVVTNDAQVAAEAAARGAAAIGEPVCAPGIDGLNAAVAAAADPLTARGRAVLVLHAD